MALQWKKVCAGYYRLTIGPGELDRFEAYYIDAAEMRGTGYGAHWNFTPPGSGSATDSVDTLRQCKEWAAHWLANTDIDTWRAEMNAAIDAAIESF